MMKKNIMLFALAALVLASCKGGLEKGDGGLLYKIDVDKGGNKIQEGDFISFNFTAKAEGDSILINTYEKSYPTYTVVPKAEHSGDMNAALLLLAEGDSATIKTNIDSLYGKQRQKLPLKGSYITYQIKIEKVIPKKGLGDAEFNAQIINYTNSQTDLLKKEEPGKLKKYIADNKLTGVTTKSGLFYDITKPGTGDKPGMGDTVVINYVSTFLNHKLAVTNILAVAEKYKHANPMARYVPYSFPIGSKEITPAWNEGMQLLNKGAKAIIVAPSSLVSEKNTSRLQWATPLVFEIEVLDIKHPKTATK